LYERAGDGDLRTGLDDISVGVIADAAATIHRRADVR
jgi:hypothetical protein